MYILLLYTRWFGFWCVYILLFVICNITRSSYTSSNTFYPDYTDHKHQQKVINEIIKSIMKTSSH